MNNKEEQKLQNFLLDFEAFQELSKWTGNFNIFKVLGITQAELKHSNMLAWLLDPNGNHQLGDSFLKLFLQELFINITPTFDVLLADLYKFEIYREWHRIDIFLIQRTEKIIIAIENKITAAEGKDQLKRYRNLLDQNYKEEEGWKKFFIFLSPNGLVPSDENWQILTYNDIEEILKKIVKNIQKDGIRILVSHYLEILRSDIMKNNEDLRNLCNKIYKKHHEAIDLINEYRTDLISQSIQEQIKEYPAENDNIEFDAKHSNNTFSIFHTKRMNKFLGQLSNKQSGSWNTGEVYRYWISYETQKDGSKKIYGVLELGWKDTNENEQITHKMEKLFSYCKNKDKHTDRFTRIYRTGSQTIREGEEDLEKAFKNATENILKKLLKKEDELLQKEQA